ncbi:hypothetical protein BR93DRAFT_798440 [Coniochaeta sp. PMI_546]|nr:hypothetical protein BR93DRAFT_798440 [Coniochaeta sp. PMI_546]
MFTLQTARGWLSAQHIPTTGDTRTQVSAVREMTRERYGRAHEGMAAHQPRDAGVTVEILAVVAANSVVPGAIVVILSVVHGILLCVDDTAALGLPDIVRRPPYRAVPKDYHQPATQLGLGLMEVNGRNANTSKSANLIQILLSFMTSSDP